MALVWAREENDRWQNSTAWLTLTDHTTTWTSSETLDDGQHQASRGETGNYSVGHVERADLFLDRQEWRHFFADRPSAYLVQGTY